MRFVLGLCALMLAVTVAAEQPRLFVLTDIGNEPDDQMSLVRLLLYANEIDIEGMVAVTSTWKKDEVSPEMIADVVGNYGEVPPGLWQHTDGWSEAKDLLSRRAAATVTTSKSQRQTGIGEAVNAR